MVAFCFKQKLLAARRTVITDQDQGCQLIKSHEPTARPAGRISTSMFLPSNVLFSIEQPCLFSLPAFPRQTRHAVERRALLREEELRQPRHPSRHVHTRKWNVVPRNKGTGHVLLTIYFSKTAHFEMFPVWTRVEHSQLTTKLGGRWSNHSYTIRG